MGTQGQHCAAVSEMRRRDNAYILWAATESESGDALGAWFAAVPSRRPSAYAVYRAALEREEAAARHLERLSGLTGSCVALSDAPLGELR
jgi:hypothetical protein